ncbi:MAG: stage III sporulation protein AB [Oscillospiraceae bacterium]|jgi:stage III sporulation protein AA|nr:stage III sporulation protein AB [Oscillospiraceae bacterium]
MNDTALRAPAYTSTGAFANAPAFTNAEAYSGALRLLPTVLRAGFETLDTARRARAEELRLRTGFRPTVVFPDGEISAGETLVTRELLAATLDIATGASAHTARDTMRQGFVTARGGYRLGLGGSVATERGEAAGYRALSSIAVRIPREHRGVAAEAAREIAGGRARSTLILSPPGVGKTTFLRDLTRIVSDGAPGVKARRVGLADERGELASLHDGVPQLYVGARTDILDGCPKAEAVLIFLRVMNPEVIALDEISAPEDARAILLARNCGVALFATAHAAGREDLERKPLYRDLLADGAFETLVTVEKRDGRRVYRAERL